MEENIREILMGGQSFSWTEEADGAYVAVLQDKVHRIRTMEDVAQDAFLRRYFDFDYDYEEARRRIMEKDSILREAVESVGKLRILKQDEWTTAISFILSQNNNIKRIKSLYDRLSSAYGHEVEKGYWSFPTAEELEKADEASLRALGIGFRAPFILDAVKHREVFEKAKTEPFEKAMETLMTVKGIGPKVASCILIFGYGRREGFPMDTWMKQCMATYYPGKDSSYFSPYEALSQQYLFSFMRAG